MQVGSTLGVMPVDPPTRILVATRDGLHSLDRRGTHGPVEHAGRDVTAVMRDGPQRWAITDRSEVWYAPTAEWTRVAGLEGLDATCIAMTDAVHVGSAEARLFRFTGDALEPVAAFDTVEGRSAWYTPWGGPPDVRSMSEWDDDVYVNVHVGGILRTSDSGETWAPTIDIDADIHQVATAEGLVLAACAEGVATSADRGETWTIRADGLEAPYARAVTVCGDAILVSASNGPRGGHAAVYRGDLAGGGFERCRAGLPEWLDANIDTYCLDALNDGSFAAFGTSEGSVFVTDDAGSSWHELASGLPAIRHILVMP
jgi:photosystem II stability/assembly factor-like uncharacterized protein